MGFDNLIIYVRHIGTSEFFGGDFGKNSGIIVLLDTFSGMYTSRKASDTIN